MIKYPRDETAYELFKNNSKPLPKKGYVTKHHKIIIDKQLKIALTANLGLESLVARAEGAFRVIAESVSAALA